MHREKLIVLAIAMILTIGPVVTKTAEAGEKVSAHATSVTTESKQFEVGDEEGHVLILYQASQIWIDDKTGEKSVGVSSGTIDMRFKTGQGLFRGYNVRTFPNGDKFFSKYEGKPVAKGHAKGTITYLGGTGKFEGLSGSGTWESRSMAPGVAYMTSGGVREYGQ